MENIVHWEENWTNNNFGDKNKTRFRKLINECQNQKRWPVRCYAGLKSSTTRTLNPLKC